VKINEVIVEALNTNTGTPNPAAPANPPADDNQTQWTGRKPAAPAKPDYSQKPGAYATNPGTTAKYNVPTGIPNPTPATPAAQPAPAAPIDTAYQDQLDQNIQQKQQAAVAANQANTPAQKAKQGLKNLGGALSKGIQGAVKGYQQARNTRQAIDQAKQAGGLNLELETNAANKFLAQRGAVTNLKDPATFQKELQAWAGKRYPGLDVGNIDVSKVRPGNKNDVQNYVTQVYSTYMADRANKPKTAAPATKTAAAPAATQSTIIDPATGKPFAPATQPAAQPAPAATTAAPATAAPAPDAHDEKDIKHDMVPGMEIVQQEPIIVKYKNREFGLDDNGQWVHLGGTKTPHQSFQAMLDKAAGFSESFDPAAILENKLRK